MNGPVIAPARPSWRVWVAALVIGLLVFSRAGLGFGAVAAFLSVLSSAAWQIVALLGYIAGALTEDDDDPDGEQHV